MNKIQKLRDAFARWMSVPWYPFVFSLFPILTVLDTNIGQVEITLGIRPAIVSLCIAILLFALLFLFLRNIYRAAFLTLLWLVLFFSYGHFRIFLNANYPNSLLTRRLLELWLVLTILSWWWITRPGITFRDTVGSLNVVCLALVVSLLVQTLMAWGTVGSHALGAKNAPIQDDLVRPLNPPDVYYFILDSYGRSDLLEQAYGYDNTTFVNDLHRRGFYIAECSQSNYLRTDLSLGSTLNMSYLPGLDPAFVPESINRAPLWRALKYSAVRYNFEKMGYLTIGFATGFQWNELDDADFFFTPPLTASMTDFESLFLRTTVGFHAREFGWIDTDKFMAQNYRDRSLLVFNKMDDIARMPESTFAYIHVILPHPPFVFGADGEFTDPADFWDENYRYSAESYAQGYQNQLTFLNRELISAVDTLLSESDTPPIIVMQGDHGPWFQPINNRMKIFNAYFLPGNNEKLYPGITPVNTFRVIFETYFDGTYDVLPDVSYSSPVPNLYEFSEISNPCVK